MAPTSPSGYQQPMAQAPEAIRLWSRRLTLRSSLTAEQVADLLDLPYQERSFVSGNDLVRLGELTTESCLVAEGVVGAFHQDNDGLRQISAVFIPGDMADLHSVPLPKAGAALTALGPVRVLKIPHQALRALAERHPTVAEAYWRDCTVDAQIVSEWVFTLGRFGAASRLAHLLCELGVRHEGIGHARTRYPLPFTQVHLGEVLGLTSVHINRTLRELRDAGLVEVTDRSVTVHDWAGLATVGQFDLRYLHVEQEPRV